MKLRILHKGLIYLCLPLVAQGLFLYELFNLIHQTERSMERQIVHINMSHEMNFIIIQFCRTLAACGNGGGGGTMPVAEYRKLMDLHLARLESNIKSTSEDYQQVFNSSRKLVTAQYDLLALLQSEAGSGLDTMGRLLVTKQLISSAQAAGPTIYQAWNKEEHLLEEERLNEQESREKIKKLVAWATIFDFILAIVFIVVFIKNITQRLNMLVKNARVLPSSAELPFKVSGSDEIAFLDEAMHEASAELLKAAGYRRSLLEMMAHDLRNPLMSIAVAFEVMLKSSQGGQVMVDGHKVRSLRQSLKQVTTLLDDLLALDRMEATELQLELSLINTRELVRDSCELVRAQADEKSIRLEPLVDPAEIIVDRNRLLQVLGNLIGNAIRYSPAGSIVKVVVRNQKEAGNVVFLVVDQGPGIASELHDSLFEKYFQVKQSKRISGGLGYGLGLAICKQIVVKHGGEIGIDSAPGQGATFWFTVPLDQPLEDENEDVAD